MRVNFVIFVIRCSFRSGVFAGTTGSLTECIAGVMTAPVKKLVKKVKFIDENAEAVRGVASRRAG